MGSSPPLTRAGLLQRVFFLDAPCSSLPSLHSPHSSREQSLPFSSAQKLPGSSRSPPQLPPWRHTSPLAPPPCSSLYGEAQRPLPWPAPTRGAATAASIIRRAAIAHIPCARTRSRSNRRSPPVRSAASSRCRRAVARTAGRSILVSSRKEEEDPLWVYGRWAQVRCNVSKVTDFVLFSKNRISCLIAPKIVKLVLLAPL
jgi:hypothetical protein